MSRSITTVLPESVEVLLEKLHHMAHKHEFLVEGDVHAGFAKGKGFHIDYKVLGESCTLTVLKKPLFVPWVAVEKMLAKMAVRSGL